MKHRPRKKRKYCAKYTSNRTINSHCTIRDWRVAVHDIRETLNEKQIHAAANQAARNDLTRPGYMRFGCPSKPEQTDWNHHAANNHKWEARLWIENSVACVGVGLKVNVIVDKYETRSQESTDDHTKERKRCDATLPTTDLTKSNGETLVKEKKEAVNK